MVVPRVRGAIRVRGTSWGLLSLLLIAGCTTPIPEPRGAPSSATASPQISEAPPLNEKWRTVATNCGERETSRVLASPELSGIFPPNAALALGCRLIGAGADNTGSRGVVSSIDGLSGRATVLATPELAQTFNAITYWRGAVVVGGVGLDGDGTLLTFANPVDPPQSLRLPPGTGVVSDLVATTSAVYALCQTTRGSQVIRIDEHGSRVVLATAGLTKLGTLDETVLAAAGNDSQTLLYRNTATQPSNFTVVARVKVGGLVTAIAALPSQVALTIRPPERTGRIGTLLVIDRTGRGTEVSLASGSSADAVAAVKDVILVLTSASGSSAVSVLRAQRLDPLPGPSGSSWSAFASTASPSALVWLLGSQIARLAVA